MRIKPEQLESQLQKAMAHLYVVFGDEPLLVEESADQIRQAARQTGCAEREIHHVEGNFRWDKLKEDSMALSLFSQRRLIDIRIPSGKPGTEGSKYLQTLANQPAGDNITLITLPKLDKATQNSKWFSALEQAGISIGVSAVTPTALPRWLADRLARQNQSTTGAALRLISEKVEGNLLAAQQEINKLGLQYPAGPLRLEQVQDAVLDVARFDAFQLADALLSNQPQRIVRILTGLQSEGEAPTLVLWVITKEIRLLRQLSDLSPSPRTMRELGIWESRQAIYQHALQRIDPAALHAALHQTAAIDRMIKGLDSREPWLEIEQLLLSLCAPRAAR